MSYTVVLPVAFSVATFAIYSYQHNRVVGSTYYSRPDIDKLDAYYSFANVAGGILFSTFMGYIKDTGEVYQKAVELYKEHQELKQKYIGCLKHINLEVDPATEGKDFPALPSSSDVDCSGVDCLPGQDSTMQEDAA